MSFYWSFLSKANFQFWLFTAALLTRPHAQAYKTTFVTEGERKHKRRRGPLVACCMCGSIQTKFKCFVDEMQQERHKESQTGLVCCLEKEPKCNLVEMDSGSWKTKGSLHIWTRENPRGRLRWMANIESSTSQTCGCPVWIINLVQVAHGGIFRAMWKNRLLHWINTC